MKWDLTYHFKNDNEFEKAFNKTVSIIDKLASFKGKLGNESDFLSYFDLQKEFGG